MSEKVVRGWVVKALSPLHAVAIENRCGLGTPDVAHALGWLELKHVEAAPVRADTPVRLPHYTTDQRVWAKLHCRAGGDCKMLLQVGHEVFLLDGHVAASIIGTVTLTEIRAQALKKWTGRPTPSDLLNAVIWFHTPWSRSFLRRVKSCEFSGDARTGD